MKDTPRLLVIGDQKITKTEHGLLIDEPDFGIFIVFKDESLIGVVTQMVDLQKKLDKNSP